jgi:aminoglycoside 3-N-acetyltransferase I
MKFNNEAIRIKRLDKDDVLFFQKLIQLFNEVFETKKTSNATKAYLKKQLGKPEFIVFTIFYDNEIIGGFTAYELPMYYSEYSEVFIYDIAIKHEFQRKGLGEKLLLALKEYCKQNGIKEIFVAANEEDKHALDFYKSTGGKAEKVMHFNYDMAQIR